MCAPVYAHHDVDNVVGGRDVEDFEEEVPHFEVGVVIAAEGVRVEEVDIARAEDEGIEELG